MMTLSSRKIGAALALVFIIGISVATVYSRGFAERQKPFVHISFPHEGTFFWDFETRSTMRSANDDEAERGHAWLTEIIVPFEAFGDYVNAIAAVDVELNLDLSGNFRPARIAYRSIFENGDILYIFSYQPDFRVGINTVVDGEGVTVRISHRGQQVFDNLLPFSAIHQDPFTGNQYVFVVRRRDGAWGREYIVERVDIEICVFLPRFAHLANIMLPNFVGQPIVIHSEATLFCGAGVRIFD